MQQCYQSFPKSHIKVVPSVNRYLTKHDYGPYSPSVHDLFPLFIPYWTATMSRKGDKPYVAIGSSGWLCGRQSDVASLRTLILNKSFGLLGFGDSIYSCFPQTVEALRLWEKHIDFL